jgi:DNA-binding PadR family transcriptional regulator
MTNKEMAVLGLLLEGSRHGYQIENDIEDRGMREWTEIGFSSIYYLLNKLLDNGWAQSHLEESGEGPPRKVYAITGAGVRALQDAVARRLSAPTPFTGEFDLALAYAAVLDTEAVLDSLAAYRDRLRDDLVRVQGKWDAQRQDGLPAHVNALFDHSLHTIRAELAWVEQFLEQERKKDMAKKDYKIVYKALYNPGKDPEVVDVPEFNFLMIDGIGDPNTAQSYQDAVGALYKLAYAIRFHMRDAQGLDFGVMPLEGLWWVDDLADFSYDDKSGWHWTMMIMQPEGVTAEIIEAIREQVRNKHNPPRLDAIRFEAYHEGTSVQMMHHGPYADEPSNIAKMDAYMAENGYQAHMKHHEIYLKNPNRTKPENLLTVLRHPVRKTD